jgi:4-hydroxyacetophenone monooxygenase
MSTYYRNSKGRVVVPIPFRNSDFWWRAQGSSLDDYVITPAQGSGASPSAQDAPI